MIPKRNHYDDNKVVVGQEENENPSHWSHREIRQQACAGTFTRRLSDTSTCETSHNEVIKSLASEGAEIVQGDVMQEDSLAGAVAILMRWCILQHFSAAKIMKKLGT